ncbi:hypothetical protein FPV67DRAFT_1416807, partial [Lyophyllum atratum]
GIYFLLFGSCVVILCRKDRIPWILLLAATAMFSLASADMGYTLDLVFQHLLKGELTYEALSPKYVMYVTNSAMADTVLLYRCYLIWSSKTWVIIGPAILLVAATACGFVFEGRSIALERYSWIYLSMSVAVNIITTAIAAGRLMYVSRSARVMLGEDVSRRYRSTVGVIIESGFIYTLYTSLDLILRNNATANIILDSGLIQIVGIMPTLIIVQTSLDRATRGGTTSSRNIRWHTSPESVLVFPEQSSSSQQERVRGSHVFIPFVDMTPQDTRASPTPIRALEHVLL